jgi:tetratricopeptide (TPR) repeat protein
MNDSLVLVIAIVCFIVFLLIVANEWRKAYRVHRAAQQNAGERRKQPSSWWLFLAVLGLAGCAFAVEELTGWDARLVAAIMAVVVVAVLIAGIIFLPRWRYRGVFRMLRLAQSGKATEAIFRIRQEIDNKGPSAERWNLLGLMLSLQENWPESLQAFQEAERLRVPTATDVANKGTVLWKMGRLEDAEQHLERAYCKEPNSFTTVSNYCLLMVDAQKIDKAKKLLREAEALDQRQVIVWPAAERPRRKETLEECRRKVQSMQGAVDGGMSSGTQV